MVLQRLQTWFKIVEKKGTVEGTVQAKRPSHVEAPASSGVSYVMYAVPGGLAMIMVSSASRIVQHTSMRTLEVEVFNTEVCTKLNDRAKF